MKLGVNVDHVATLRQARRGNEPDPLAAALCAQAAGATSIVLHLREDRRHIQDHDVRAVKDAVNVLNLEMSIAPSIVRIAQEVKPYLATLVPERREEITTEGGLDVVSSFEQIRTVVDQLHSAGIRVSLFIDPVTAQIKAAAQTAAEYIELHTGAYANATTPEEITHTFDELRQATAFAQQVGLRVNAGHGLHYANVQQICSIAGCEELNIGHAIIAHAVTVGLDTAVRQMLDIIKQCVSVSGGEG